MNKFNVENDEELYRERLKKETEELRINNNKETFKFTVIYPVIFMGIISLILLLFLK